MKDLPMTPVSLPRPARRPRALLLAALCALAVGGPAWAQAPAAPAAPAAQDSSIVLVGRDGWLFPAWGSLTEVDTAAVARNTELIADAQHALAAAGIALQVLVLPDKALFYEDRLPDGKRLGDPVRGRYALEVDGLSKAQVPAIDALQVLRQVRQGGQDVFYRSDQHWTQPAADAVATAVAAKVKEQVPVLAGQAGSGMVLGSEVKERRFGDLAELFLTDEQRKAIGRDTFTVRRQAEQQSLLDDAPAPVHVTGHSMVQPYFGFPQKLSNLLDRPVSVNPAGIGELEAGQRRPLGDAAGIPGIGRVQAEQAAGAGLADVRALLPAGPGCARAVGQRLDHDARAVEGAPAQGAGAVIR